MEKDTRRKTKLTSAELMKSFWRKHGKPLPVHEDDFPRWIWPYIRRAVLAGKLNEDLTVPDGAEIRDYSLVVVGFLKKANISFPGVNIAELPDGFFAMVKEELDAKRIDQYGKVITPEDMGNIPRPLWPYVTPRFRIGELLNVEGFISFNQELASQISEMLDQFENPIKPGLNDMPIKNYPGRIPFPIIPKV